MEAPGLASSWCGRSPRVVRRPRIPTRSDLRVRSVPARAGGGGHDQCVSVTLHNDEPLYINQVELTTGPGFHHSNWFWVPDTSVPGRDGTWTCADRNYRGEAAGIFGGVVFAQSTQSPHEIQKFADGRRRSDPAALQAIAEPTCSTPVTRRSRRSSRSRSPDSEQRRTAKLVGMSLENMTIAIPPHEISRFTIECDLSAPGIRTCSAERLTSRSITCSPTITRSAPA